MSQMPRNIAGLSGSVFVESESMTPTRRSLLKMGAGLVAAPLAWMFGQKAAADGWKDLKVKHDYSHNHICFGDGAIGPKAKAAESIDHDGWPETYHLTVKMGWEFEAERYEQNPYDMSWWLVPYRRGPFEFRHIGEGMYVYREGELLYRAILERRDGRYFCDHAICRRDV